MSRNKLLSIIIPAYNAEKYILPCLRSLKQLMVDELEILVINDGSRDNTESIVTDYAISDQRVRLISVPNGGVSKARNTGIDNAAGRFIMFLDADDYLISDRFDKIEELVRSDEYDFVAFSRDIIEENGKIWNDPFPFDDEETSDKEISDRIMYAHSMFNECWGKLFKKSVIDENNIRFPVGVPIGEDLMFVMEYYSHCQKPYVCNSALVAYRQHGESAMKKYGIQDRMKYTQDLYSYSKKYIPEKLLASSVFYYFKVLTNLCREYSGDGMNSGAIKAIYSSQMSKEVMDKLNGRSVPAYKKHEYLMMKCRMSHISALYYFFKAKAG